MSFYKKIDRQAAARFPSAFGRRGAAPSGWWASASDAGSPATIPATSPAGRTAGTNIRALLGTERAKRAVTELACWVRAVRASASRKIEYYPVGCAGFCADECMAISLIAASQHHRCPAMRACALALTGSDLVEPVIDAANAFADALQEADQRLSQEAVAALMADRRKGGGDGLTERR